MRLQKLLEFLGRVRGQNSYFHSVPISSCGHAERFKPLLLSLLIFIEKAPTPYIYIKQKTTILYFKSKPKSESLKSLTTVNG